MTDTTSSQLLSPPESRDTLRDQAGPVSLQTSPVLVLDPLPHYYLRLEAELPLDDELIARTAELLSRSINVSPSSPNGNSLSVTSDAPPSDEVLLERATRLRDNFIEQWGVLESFLPALSPAELIRLSLTCRAMYKAVKLYMAKAFNVNTLLRRFFSSPEDFRTLQARTQTLISGSVALQFFDRSFYPESDLDLYAPYRTFRDVGNWLLGHGYTFSPYPQQALTWQEASTYPLVPAGYPFGRRRGMSLVYNFTRFDPRSQRDLTIQLIVCTRAPLEVVLNFHSSKYLNALCRTE